MATLVGGTFSRLHKGQAHDLYGPLGPRIHPLNHFASARDSSSLMTFDNLSMATLNESLDTTAMVGRAIKNNVAYVSGSAFYPKGEKKNSKVTASCPSCGKISECIVIRSARDGH